MIIEPVRIERTRALPESWLPFIAVWIPPPKEQSSERTPSGLPPAVDAAYAMRLRDAPTRCAYAMRRSMTAFATLFRIEDRSDGMVGLNFAVNFLREDAGRDANTPLEVMLRQIDYLVDRVRIDRVGFGSDFDGVLISREIGDASGLPRPMSALRDRGYDDKSLRKLAHKNWGRILSKTWGE